MMIRNDGIKEKKKSLQKSAKKRKDDLKREIESYEEIQVELYLDESGANVESPPDKREQKGKV